MPEFYIAPEASIRYELRAPGVSEPQPFPANPALRLPLDSANGLNDISGNGRNGTAAGGLTVGGYADAPGPADGDTATDFDGTDDRITTTYSTRRNLWTNPSFETNITGITNSTCTTARSSTQAKFDTYSCQVTSTGAGAAPNTSPAISTIAATAGTAYTFSFYLYHTVAGRQGRADLRFYDASDVLIGSGTAGTAATATQNTWTRFSVTATAPALTAKVGFVCRCDATLAGSSGEVSYLDGLMIEAASSAGTYFDGSGYVNDSGTWVDDEGGHTGWLGTAHASASDIGPFANGTARTFSYWMKSDALALACTLANGSATPYNIVGQFAAGGSSMTLYMNSASAAVWDSLGLAAGVWYHIAVTVNEPTDTAEMFVNGVSQGTKALGANQWGADSTGITQIGRFAGGQNFDGKMAEVCVYERALTATEIQAAVAAETPARAVAVLNDPSDPDFCGYLDGEEAISGIDSPEIRDSYADLVEQDGGIGATNFYSRRPIVMNGKVLPISAADRNAKLGKLMAATEARSADGTLSWTPTGGEPVFAKFRRQLPFRAKGGFNKDFQIGIVCNDPRIYTQKAMTVYTETNGNSVNQDFRRFTWSASSPTTIATRSLYLPPGVWKVTVPVKRSAGAGNITASLSNSTGTSTPLAVSAGNWQLLTQTLTTANAESVATTLTIAVTSALSSGQYVEVGDPILESAAGLYPSDTATFATNWTAGTDITASFVTASPPPSTAYPYNPGNALSRPRQRVIGPFSQIAAGMNALNYVRLYPSVAYTGTDYAVIDYGFRTVVKNNTSNDYGSIPASPSTTWGGLPPDVQYAAILYGLAGCSTATRMESTWRGVWL